VLAAGCGDGDSDTEENSSSDLAGTFRGQFIDSAVEGLSYSTASQSGVTDKDGTFFYRASESITFKVGEIEIGTYEPGSIITPSQMTGAGATNTAAFLLTLDDDQDYENGILITDAVSNLASGALNFNQSFEQFQSDSNVQQTVNNLTKETNAGERQLVGELITLNHLNASERAIIASRLFKIPLSQIDNSNSGANYNYNPYGNEDTDREGKCEGYDGGHSGLDIQTKDVAGTATADREFYALTSGEVISASSGTFNTIAVYNAEKNLTVLYLHARSVSVSVSQTVAAGQELGIQGNEGLSSNPSTAEHVHVEVRSGRRQGPACGASTSLDPDSHLIEEIASTPNNAIAGTIEIQGSISAIMEPTAGEITIYGDESSYNFIPNFSAKDTNTNRITIKYCASHGGPYQCTGEDRGVDLEFEGNLYSGSGIFGTSDRPFEGKVNGTYSGTLSAADGSQLSLGITFTVENLNIIRQ
jgi:murein DD-endopeptidase MepM/ murein hydrolase activator NlpD